MQVVKRRTFSGVVCEQEIYRIAGKAPYKLTTEPRLRFKNEEERERHKEEISRRNHALLFNENFSTSSLYGTLTFDDENEVYTFSEARWIRDNYIRRLKYKYPDAVIFIYMGRGKSTHRIHFHIVCEGVPSDYLIKQWRYGSVVRVEHLREHNYYNGIDHGQDYSGLANYLFNHWTKEQGGHRWRMTRNAKKPLREEFKPVQRRYSESRPPRAPKGYKLVETKSTAYGYLYFKYVKEPPKDSRGRGRKTAEIRSV